MFGPWFDSFGRKQKIQGRVCDARGTDMTQRERTATENHRLPSSPHTTMLSSPMHIPASSDVDFFSPSKNSKFIASSSPPVTVTTRLVSKPGVKQSPTLAPSRSSSISLSPLTSPESTPPRKRKSSPAYPDHAGPSTAPPRQVKKLRTEKPRIKRVSHSSKSSSRASSRQQTLAPSPEPIYRSSRSRSTSHFPTFVYDTPIVSRRWSANEDGDPGENHTSSEAVVLRLLKSYKGCKWSKFMLRVVA